MLKLKCESFVSLVPVESVNKIVDKTVVARIVFPSGDEARLSVFVGACGKFFGVRAYRLGDDKKFHPSGATYRKPP